MPTPLQRESDRSLLQRISDTVDRFEAMLNSGSNPRIELLVEEWRDPELPALLAELVGVELEHRVRRAERPTLSEYQIRFAQYRNVIDKEFPASIGNYDLLELVGLGAFGRVYRGRLKGTNICHALKILNENGGSVSLDSVVKEFQSLARIKHAGIVTAHNLDVGQNGTPAYIAMEFVEGKSLQEVLKSGRLPIKRAALLTCEIAEVLAAAHTAGVIHRDLKPANILIDQEWHPHLTDFGLALLNVNRHESREELAGTLVYAPPEYIRSEVSDPRSDIWSVGVILYEMLTGEVPFHRTTRQELLDQIQNATPTEPRILRPDLPLKLQQICLRCLQKDRAKRWTTSYDLASALQSVAVPPPQPRVKRTWTWMTAFAALLLTAGGVWYRYANNQRSDGAILAILQLDLKKDSDLKSADVQATVDRGTVTLTGEVEQDSARVHAGAIAGREPGVRLVINNLLVPNANPQIPITPARRDAGMQSNGERGVKGSRELEEGSASGVSARNSFLRDDFGAERSLNESLWKTRGDLLVARLLKADTRFVPVRLGFTNLGMTMAGVDGKYESTGIQSAKSFSAPFALEAKVMGTISNGNPFALYLLGADGTEYLAVNGNLGGSNDSYSGISIGHTGSGNDSGRENSVLLTRDASIDRWYIIRFVIDERGNGSVTIADGQGKVLGRQDHVYVGRGPYFVVLSQWEGWPHNVGRNEAIWASVSLSAQPRSF